MVVSINGGTPKSSMFMGFSLVNPPFWGDYPISENPSFIEFASRTQPGRTELVWHPSSSLGHLEGSQVRDLSAVEQEVTDMVRMCTYPAVIKHATGASTSWMNSYEHLHWKIFNCNVWLQQDINGNSRILKWRYLPYRRPNNFRGIPDMVEDVPCLVNLGMVSSWIYNVHCLVGG